MALVKSAIKALVENDTETLSRLRLTGYKLGYSEALLRELARRLVVPYRDVNLAIRNTPHKSFEERFATRNFHTATLV